MTFHVTRDPRHPRAIRLTEIDPDSPGRDDNRSRPRVEPPSGRSSGTTGDRNRDNPRAAGAGQSRVAQPPARAFSVCDRCRKRVQKMRNGAWYHTHNSSESCYPGDGTRRKAIPLAVAL